MPTAQACVVCGCCVCGAPVLLGTLRCTRATGKAGGRKQGRGGRDSRDVGSRQVLIIIFILILCVVW